MSRHQASAQPKFDMPDDLSAQLRLAEERISKLEAQVRYYEERADRAERWVYKIWVEIEQKFFGGDAIRPLVSSGAKAEGHSFADIVPFHQTSGQE